MTLLYKYSKNKLNWKWISHSSDYDIFDRKNHVAPVSVWFTKVYAVGKYNQLIYFMFKEHTHHYTMDSIEMS